MKINKGVLYFVIVITLFNLFIPEEVYGKQAKQLVEVKSINDTSDLYKDAMLTLLYPYIRKAIQDHPEVPDQTDLYDSKIISIEKPGSANEFIITVQVYTFTGAHNPPRGIETITIKTDAFGTEVIKFVHKAG